MKIVLVAACALIDEVMKQAEAARATHGNMAEAVFDATEALREATEWMASQSDINERFAGSVPFLMAFGRVLGAHFHLKAACAETGAEGAEGPRTRLARFYIARLLPEHAGLLAHATQGAEGLYALTLDDMSA